MPTLTRSRSPRLERRPFRAPRPAAPGAPAVTVAPYACYRCDEEFHDRRDESGNRRHLVEVDVIDHVTPGLVGHASISVVRTDMVRGLRFLYPETAAPAFRDTSIAFSVHGQIDDLAGADPEVGSGFASFLSYGGPADLPGDWIAGVLPTGAVVLYHRQTTGADGGGRHVTTAAGLVSQGVPFHLAGVSTPDGVTLLVNGTVRETTAGTFPAGFFGGNRFELCAGLRTRSGGGWHGPLADFGFWNSVSGMPPAGQLAGYVNAPIVPYPDPEPEGTLWAGLGCFQSEGGGVAGDGQPVGYWTGTGLTAHSTGASRPILRANQLNGQPALEFGGTQAMTLGGAGTWDEFTAIAVLKPTSGALLTSNKGTFLGLDASTPKNWRFNPGTGEMTLCPTAVNLWMVIQIRVRDGKLQLFRDHARINDDQPATVSGLTLSALGGGMLLAEVRTWPRALPDWELQRERDDLRARYPDLIGLAEPVLITTDVTRYYHPTDTIRLTSGDWLMMTRDAPGHVPDYEGALKAWRSADGLAWTDPPVLVKSIATDLRNGPGMIQLTGGGADHGRIIEPWFSINPNLTFNSAGMVYSDDDGATWDDLGSIALPTGPGGAYEGLFTYGRLFELTPGGVIVMPAYARYEAPPNDWFYDAILLQSVDRGVNWTLRGVIAEGDPPSYSETSIFPLGGSNWLAWVRDDGTNSCHLFLSADGGVTWTKEGRQVMGVGQDIIRLASGKICLGMSRRTAQPWGPRLYECVADDYTPAEPGYQIYGLVDPSQYNYDGGYLSLIQMASGVIHGGYNRWDHRCCYSLTREADLAPPA